MSEKLKISLKLQDDTNIFGLNWTADTKAKANVIIMTGMEEHSSRYDDFAKFLNKHGFNVYCLDNFGQGENVLPDMSNRGIWPASGFRKQVEAVDMLVNKLRITYLPVFIFSHSMGSFLAQDYIQRHTHHVSKVVLCGSNLNSVAPVVGYMLAKIIVNKKNREQKAKLLNNLMFGNFNKKIQNPRTPFDWLSVNEDNVNKYIEDPLCGFGPNNGFCLEFLKGLRRLYRRKFLEKIRKDLDLFIISGAEDPVSSYGKGVYKLEKMYKKYHLTNVSTKVYDGLRHEILNEIDHDVVYNDILEFFERDLEKKNAI